MHACKPGKLYTNYMCIAIPAATVTSMKFTAGRYLPAWAGPKEGQCLGPGVL